MFDYGSPWHVKQGEGAHMSKHTPTPWRVHDLKTRDGNGVEYVSYAVADARDRLVMDATNSSVAEIRWEHDGEPAGYVQHFDVQSEADAAFIVKACNAHADLVAALQALSLWFDGEKTPDGWIHPHGTREMRALIKAVLAKAE